MFLAFCMLTIGWLTTSSSANMVLSYGTCPEVPGQENFDWFLHRGRWYVEEAFDVPYLTHLYCMTIDYILLDNKTITISTNGIRHYDWFGFFYWQTPVMIREEGIVANLSEPSVLTASLGQHSLHFYKTRYVIVTTNYDSYSLVYACYQQPTFNIKIESAWILTRKFGDIPENLESLKNNLTVHNVDTENFKLANNTHCCVWRLKHYGFNDTVPENRTFTFTDGH